MRSQNQAPSKGLLITAAKRTCQNLWSPRSWSFDPQNMEMGTAILQFVLILYCMILYIESRDVAFHFTALQVTVGQIHTWRRSEVWVRPNCAAFASRPWHRAQQRAQGRLLVKHQERWWQALVGIGESMIDRNSMNVRIFRSRASKNDRFCLLFIVLLLYTIPKTFAEYPQNRKQKTDASRSQEWPVEHPVESYWYWIGWSRHRWSVDDV